MNNGISCPKCGRPCNGLYEVFTDRSWEETELVCFFCLPADVIARYDGWEEREKRQRQAAARRQQNLHREANHAPRV